VFLVPVAEPSATRVWWSEIIRRGGTVTVGPAELHTIARRYLLERHAEWTRRYSEIGAPTGRRYSAAALDTFPRYQVLQAILDEVERWQPGDFPDLPTAREALAEAGRSAESLFTQPPHGEIEARAMAEEREAFRAFVRSVPEADLAAVEPLPYRRCLREVEERRLRARLAQVWGIADHYWYPLAETRRPDVLALQAPAFDRAIGGPGLQRIVGGWGVRRVWELREYAGSYELELSELMPHYTGAEGYWTAVGKEWIVYASHESSVTVGGSALVEAVQQAWPDWADYVWTTPFF
jgi:hypothetical protein